MNLQFLLPNSESLTLCTTELDEKIRLLRVTAGSRNKWASCPTCQQPSVQIHSRYTRTLADLPAGGWAVELIVQVRRFFCRNRECNRQIFAERLKGIALPYARRTERLDEMLQAIGLLVGSSTDLRVAETMKLPASIGVLLKLIRRYVPTEAQTPRVLGIDDWAMKRGHRCGTILVNLETRQVVDLLPDRETNTVARWLQAHPGVEIISRDRAGAYADAAQQGAPAALQVPDRWHILKNLGEALIKVLEKYQRDIKRISKPTATDCIVPAAPQVNLKSLRSATLNNQREQCYIEIRHCISRECLLLI